MKLVKTLMVYLATFVCMASLSVALAAPSCCVKEKAKSGKACTHPCCVEAVKAGKTCDKCQAKPSCCDKELAKGKDCTHPCCVEATKKKEVCEKCNPKS